jgi:hypothetical protein
MQLLHLISSPAWNPSILASNSFSRCFRYILTSSSYTQVTDTLGKLLDAFNSKESISLEKKR